MYVIQQLLYTHYLHLFSLKGCDPFDPGEKSKHLLHIFYFCVHQKENDEVILKVFFSN